MPDQKGTSWGTPPPTGARQRCLPSEDAVRSHLGSLSLNPLLHRRTYNFANPPDNAPRLSDISLALTFSSSRLVGSPLTEETIQHLNNEQPVKYNHGCGVNNNQNLHYVGLPNKLEYFGKDVWEKEDARLLLILRERGHILHGPEQVLRAEIHKRHLEYPNFPLLLLIGIPYAHYLGDLFWDIPERLESRSYYSRSFSFQIPESHTLYPTVWEGTHLIIETSDSHRPTPGTGQNPAKTAAEIQGFEFAVLARPQLDITLAYSLHTTLERANRYWQIKLAAEAYMSVSCRPYGVPQQGDDVFYFGTPPPAAERFLAATEE